VLKVNLNENIMPH